MNKRKDFLKLFGTLGASLLQNLLTSNGTITAKKRTIRQGENF